MTLSQKAIDEFKEIWIKEYGEKIDSAQAENMANKLISLMRVIYQPIPKHRNEKTNGK